jgi:hypothetical protein
MSSWPRITNGKIVRTMLGTEDHGIMSFFVFVEWPGAGCGLGGYCLDSHVPPDKRAGHGHSYQAIRCILETVGVDAWEKLPGTLIRLEDNGAGSRLTKIGHIMEDRWFDIETYMKEGQLADKVE